MIDREKISAVILAAGLSSRMGNVNKMLVEVDGRPMLWHVVNNLLSTDIYELIIVLGHQAKVVAQIVPTEDTRVKIVHNENYQEGMSTSISTGVSSLAREAQACLICMGDMPYIQTSEFHTIIQTFQNKGSTISTLVPFFGSQAGHPVIFGAQYFGELINLSAEDKGAKMILDKYRHRQISVAMDTDHVLKDIDTMPPYEK